MPEHIYVAFYKPYGVLTAFTDPEGRDTLKAYIDIPGIYAAGRLDLDSEGLLFLTDDGNLAHRLTDPGYQHSKTYYVQVEGEPRSEMIARLERGVEIKGRMTRPCEVKVILEPDIPARAKPVTPHGPTVWLQIILREGMKRQIRHMTAAIGLPTLRLVRVAIGSLSLNNLQPGEWRYLTPAEVNALKQLAQAPARVKVLKKTAKSPGNARGSQYRSGARRRPGH